MSLYMLIAFSLLCAGLYYVCPRRLRWLLLLAASYGFYAVSGARALPFILLTTLSTWAGALGVGRIGERSREALRAGKGTLTPAEKKAMKAAAKGRQRVLLVLTLVLNFGVLAALKYSAPVLSLLGAQPLGWVLPLGISFYTFQSMGYLIDVYSGKTAAERNPLRFALFVSFFPQLIQGPIGRYDQLAPQLLEPHEFDLTGVERGLLLMLWGFFKKKVIADRALPLVSGVFDAPQGFGGAVTVLAVLAYSLQQYADFSGGIDLVTGIAELFGVRLAPNFRRPYFAVSLGDFWRRWHISLGAWMRDYVFYPFALTRPMRALSRLAKGRFGAEIARALPAALGNILVFLLVGLWHGATANYVLWGLYNGVILAVSALLEPAFRRFSERRAALVKSRGFHVLRVLRTFVIVNIGWYFDRCTRAAEAFSMLVRTALDWRGAQLTLPLLAELGVSPRDLGILLLSTALLFSVSLAQERGAQVRAWLLSRPLALRWLLLLIFILFILGTLVTGAAGADSFMYAVF